MTTILQISDMHLLSQPDGTLKGVPTSESLALVLQRAREEIPNPDGLVLTGDLSHEETVAGYELLKHHLGDWADRCLLIPGNHDSRSGLRQVFRQVPGTLEEPIWFCHELGPWLLLGLDSQVPGEVWGELSEQSLERLETTLAENKARPTLVFLHHHPGAVGSPWLDNIGLQNAMSLEALLSRHPGVHSLFCGHIHQVFEGEIAGVPFHSAPSAAIQFLPGTGTMQFDFQPPGFRVIDFHDGQFSTRVVRLDHSPFSPRSD
jgi:Icc protein